MLLYIDVSMIERRGEAMEDITILVARLKDGDEDAFDRLYDAYHLALYRSAYLIVGNAQDAEDVLQETFLTALTHIATLKNNQYFKAWLYRIMTNLAYKTVKRRSREQSESEEVLSSRCVAESMEKNNLEDIITLHAEQEAVRQGLLQLKLKQREVMVLYYYNGFSIREIADICGCFEGTVKSRLHKARKTLKTLLLVENNPFCRWEEA